MLTDITAQSRDCTINFYHRLQTRSWICTHLRSAVVVIITYKTTPADCNRCASPSSTTCFFFHPAVDLSVVLLMYDVGTSPVMPVCNSRHTLQPVSNRCIINKASPLLTLSCTPSVASNEWTASPLSATNVLTLVAGCDALVAAAAVAGWDTSAAGAVAAGGAGRAGGGGIGELRAALDGGRGKEGDSTTADRAATGVAGADAATRATGAVRLTGAEMVFSDIECRCCGADCAGGGGAVGVAVGVVAYSCWICRAGCGMVSGGGMDD